ncbi:hypothetical protein MKEN_00305000 [Mycena kentingensis (nom. inval.)]|nr:hypothetical protein MKEN_00305000 [Mycena kentingensis (nom. inval.)]
MRPPSSSTCMYSFPPVENDPNSRTGRIISARAVLNLVMSPPQPMVFVHPIMGTILITVFQVFLDELAKLRARRVVPDYPSEDEVALSDLLNRAVHAMTVFARLCPLLSEQAIWLCLTLTGIRYIMPSVEDS